MLSLANDETTAGAILHDHENIVNDHNYIILKQKSHPTPRPAGRANVVVGAAHSVVVGIAPIREGAPCDVSSPRNDDESTSGRTPTAGGATTTMDTSIDRKSSYHHRTHHQHVLAADHASAKARIECAEKEEEEDAMGEIGSMGSPPGTTNESCRPSMAAYPNGCPVWFDVRKSKSCPERLVATAGIIRNGAFDASGRTFEYEVEATGKRTTKTKRIEEGEIAYAVKCPVLVRIKDGGTSNDVTRDDDDDDDDGTYDAMVGEIVDVMPAIRGGVRTFLYSVLISTNYDDDDDDDGGGGGGGGVLIERDVVPERIRYRFSLEALQYSIREVTSSSYQSHRGRKRKAFGIRSNGGRHEPVRNGMPPSVEAKTKKRRKKEETSIVSLGRINVSIDADDNLDALHALPHSLVALMPQHAARGTTQGLPPSLPTPSPGNLQHHQAHQGPAISNPVTINSTAERRLDVPCISRSEVADEWRMHQRLPHQLQLRSVHFNVPQVSGKKAQMNFPDKLHRILSTPVYSHVLR